MRQGAGATRLPAYSAEVPRGTRSLLIAAWVLLAEGGVGLIFQPIIIFSSQRNVAAPSIAGFTVCLVLCLVAGGLLFSRWAWSWWFAAAVAAVVPAWLIATGGMTSDTEGYIAAGFSAVEVILLLLGRRAAGRSEALAISSADIPFRLKVGIVWAALFLNIIVLLSLLHLDWGWIRENLSFIAKGVEFTLLLAVGAILLSIVLALLGALGRTSKNPVAFALSGFYTSFFRGTPLIVQLFLIYNALPQIGSPNNLNRISLVNILTLTGFQAGVLGLGLNYGAYMTEIFRAGIQSVAHGQGEAADALGMSYVQRMRRVVLPQATRVIIPPTGNEFISMMKDTALVSFLGVDVSRAELFLRARLAGDQDLKKLEGLLVAAAMYWVLTAIFTFFQRRLERRVGRGFERTAVATRKPRPRLFTMGTDADVSLHDHPPAVLDPGGAGTRPP